MHPNKNSSRHIFLADDDCDDRQMFEEALSEVAENVILTQAKDGIELMGVLNRPPVPFPEIIFLDLNMPRRNGLDCLSEIRNTTEKPHVIMLTTSENPADIQLALKLGAAFYAVKPNTFAGLKNLIQTALSINWAAYRTPEDKRDFILR